MTMARDVFCKPT